jgi:hypothetical protein
MPRSEYSPMAVGWSNEDHTVSPERHHCLCRSHLLPAILSTAW